MPGVQKIENILRELRGMNIHSAPLSSPTKQPNRGTEAPGHASKRATGDKREAILSAALDLFVERGFFGTAVPEIAERAGVGAGTIYRYFESKEALVNAIYREQKLYFGHSVIAEFPWEAATREQFRELWGRLARFATEHTKEFVFLELHHHASYLDDESRAAEQQHLELFTQVIESAQLRGDLKEGPPRLLIGIVLGAFVGVVRNYLEIGQPLDKADWALAERCLWDAVRG